MPTTFYPRDKFPFDRYLFCECFLGKMKLFAQLSKLHGCLQISSLFLNFLSIPTRISTQNLLIRDEFSHRKRFLYALRKFLIHSFVISAELTLYFSMAFFEFFSEKSGVSRHIVLSNMHRILYIFHSVPLELQIVPGLPF